MPDDSTVYRGQTVLLLMMHLTHPALLFWSLQDPRDVFNPPPLFKHGDFHVEVGLFWICLTPGAVLTTGGTSANIGLIYILDRGGRTWLPWWLLLTWLQVLSDSLAAAKNNLNKSATVLTLELFDNLRKKIDYWNELYLILWQLTVSVRIGGRHSRLICSINCK